MKTSTEIREDVQEYYGKILKTKSDLQTSACCAADSMPAYLRPYLKNIHEEVQSRFYGCASTFPSALYGKTVVDLGCGSGRDCYLLAQVVDPEWIGHRHRYDRRTTCGSKKAYRLSHQQI